jgi:DASS family divalent anion:Na+ symporter
LAGLLTVQDLVTKTNWPLIILIGALLGISAQMGPLGVNTWLAGVLKPILSPLLVSPWIFLPFLVVFICLVRLIVISNVALIAITFAIFGPLVESAGISLYVLLCVMYFTGYCCWVFGHQSPLITSCLAAGGNKYVTQKEFGRASLMSMACCLVAYTLSIPIWRMMGLIWNP